MRKTISTPTHTSHINFNTLLVTSVEQISVSAAAAFTVDSSRVFRCDVDITPSMHTCPVSFARAIA